MVRKYICAFLCFGIAASVSADAVPRILVIQKIEKFSGDDPNVKIASMVASELDEEGRVEPIVWGLTDPIFRKALEQQWMINPPEVPSLDYAADVLGKFNAEYILYVKAMRGKGVIDIEAELYKGKRQIWKDKSQFTLSGTNPFDFENATRSAARTWAVKMSQEPFKDLPVKPRQGTPDPENSRLQNNNNVTVPPPITKKVDNTDLKNQVNQMLTLGRISSAVNLLRDAVDAEPLDAERRRMLVSALSQIGEPLLAAAEARRAAALFPEQVAFRVLAARSWMEAGNLEEATADINEAVARDANAPEIRLLMGEISLKALRYASAIEHFDATISKQPTAEAYFKRALARAMMGNLAGCQSDLEEAAKLEPTPSVTVTRERYAFAVTMIDSMVQQTGQDIQSLFQRTRLNAKDQNLPIDCSVLSNRIDAIIQVLNKLPVPKVHTNSNGIRMLALKLLLQCLSDTKGSFGTLNEDVLTDATINLGEALKNYSSAIEAYINERQTGEQSG